MDIFSSINFLLAHIVVGLLALSSGESIFSNDVMQNRVCKNSRCIDAARRILANMDKTAQPCDNFYEFACGNYMNSQENFSGSIATQADTRLTMKLKESIENKINENDCRTLQLLKSHYFTCLNEENVAETSMKQLLYILNRLGGWPVLVGKSWDESKFDWKSLMYDLRRIGYKNAMNSFVSLIIRNDPTNSTQFIIMLNEAKTGLLPAYLMKGFESKKVQAYFQYMVNIATALGVDKKYAETELVDSLKFEIELAKITLPENYQPMKAWQLRYIYSDIPWKNYINKLLWPHHIVDSSEYIVVRDNSVKNLGKLISETPKRILANYAFWCVVHESIPFMPIEFQKIKAKFDLYVYGTEFRPRWQQCIRNLRDSMPLAIGALYVRKSFDRNIKKEGEELVEYVRESFKDSLEKLEWMDKKTKKAALKKLKSLHTYVAYPDELLDDEILDKYFRNLKENPDNYLDSYLSAGLFKMDKEYQQLGKIYNKTTWTTHGQIAIVNAYYMPSENSLTIPAGIFEEELFAIDRPNYLNYGSMGHIIGHELNHAFDSTGSYFNEEGNFANWWDDKTMVEFEKRKKCLTQQYTNYTVAEVQSNIDGSKSLGENIADNGGIKQAYLAYEEYEKRNGAEPRLPGLSYSPRQLFWIHDANFYCTKYSSALFQYIFDIDVHSPAEFRIIGAYSNMPEFARDFECPLGSRMNPVKKCALW